MARSQFKTAGNSLVTNKLWNTCLTHVPVNLHTKSYQCSLTLVSTQMPAVGKQVWEWKNPEHYGQWHWFIDTRVVSKHVYIGNKHGVKSTSGFLRQNYSPFRVPFQFIFFLPVQLKWPATSCSRQTYFVAFDKQLFVAHAMHVSDKLDLQQGYEALWQKTIKTSNCQLGFGSSVWSLAADFPRPWIWPCFACTSSNCSTFGRKITTGCLSPDIASLLPVPLSQSYSDFRIVNRGCSENKLGKTASKML